MVARRQKPFRSVIYDNGVEIERDRFVGRNRIEEQFIGIDWLLSRTPQIGELQDSGLNGRFFVHVVKADITAKTGKVWILYSYNKEEVCIHGLKIYDFKKNTE